jgi:hypothetical protein
MRALIPLVALALLLSSLSALALGWLPLSGPGGGGGGVVNLRITNTGAFRITNTGVNRSISP